MFAWSARTVSLAGVLSLLAQVATAAPGPMTLADVRREIAAHGYEWEAGPTSVSNIDWDTFQAMLGLRIPGEYAREPKIDPSLAGKRDELPDRWDWRDHAGTTPVQNQGSCGSCWAFAAVGALEACARIDDGETYDLSEQQVLSCNPMGWGCNGGWFDACYAVFHEPGAVSEDCMPYQGHDGVGCSQGSCQVLARVDSILWIENTVPAIKAAVRQYGPVATSIMVYDDFRWYRTGCYEHANPVDPGQNNHAVVIVGWEDGACGRDGVWIVKNSWGLGWGDQGFIRVRYNSSGIGYGTCVFVHRPANMVAVQTSPVSTTTEANRPIEIVSRVVAHAGASLLPDSICLHYRVDGADWNCLTMEPTRDPDRWRAHIPRQDKGATIDYYVRAVDCNGHRGTSPLSAPDSLYTFDVARYWEDFEGSCVGWRVGGPEDDAATGVWTCADPVGTDAQPEVNRTRGGSRCYLTGQGQPGESAGQADVDGGQTTLYSPAFTLRCGGPAIVKYWRWFSNDSGLGPGEDPWVVQARNDGGPWVDIERTAQSGAHWMQVQADLRQVLGPDLGVVEFRFVVSDRGTPSCVEGALDDFDIVADPPVAVAARETLARPTAAVWPNPLRPGESLHIALASNVRNALLRVFAPDGRLVRELPPSGASASSEGLAWDGRDHSDRPVGAGVYFVEVSSPDGRTTKPVLVIR